MAVNKKPSLFQTNKADFRKLHTIRVNGRLQSTIQQHFKQSRFEIIAFTAARHASTKVNVK